MSDLFGPFLICVKTNVFGNFTHQNKEWKVKVTGIDVVKMSQLMDDIPSRTFGFHAFQLDELDFGRSATDQYHHGNLQFFFEKQEVPQQIVVKKFLEHGLQHHGHILQVLMMPTFPLISCLRWRVFSLTGGVDRWIENRVLLCSRQLHGWRLFNIL